LQAGDPSRPWHRLIVSSSATSSNRFHNSAIDPVRPDAGVPYTGIYCLSAELLDRKSPKRHAIGNSVVESTAFPFVVAGNNPPAIRASRQELSSVANLLWSSWLLSGFQPCETHHAECRHLASCKRILVRAADEANYAWYRMKVGRQRRVIARHHRAGVAQGVRDAGARGEPVYRFAHLPILPWPSVPAVGGCEPPSAVVVAPGDRLVGHGRFRLSL
jgi:hypothetical protein